MIMKGYWCVNKWLFDLYSFVGIKVCYVLFYLRYDIYYDINVENVLFIWVYFFNMLIGIMFLYKSKMVII